MNRFEIDQAFQAARSASGPLIQAAFVHCDRDSTG
jgi:hypothetical protein